MPGKCPAIALNRSAISLLMGVLGATTPIRIREPSPPSV
jgi:hypothetical protein